MTEEKIYAVADIGVDSEFLYFRIGDVKYRFRLSDLSAKLVMASESERNDFKLSPSGYGIHWESIDEDISIKGLLQKQKGK